MSWWDDLTGKTASDTSNAAAADTYAKQQAAGGQLRAAGSNFRTGMESIARNYDPYIETGNAGNSALRELMMNPNSVRSLPGYQFDQEQGVQALDRSAASRGMLNSGRQSKDLLRFGTGLADKTYGDQFNRLFGLTQFGENATGAKTGVEAGGYQGELGANTTAYGGDMRAAETIGQGQVAGAQARQTALGNIMGAGAYLGGAAMGRLPTPKVG